jgi:hypothetical protein
MTCSYGTCGSRLPTARLPERSESVRLSGTLCRVLAVLAVAGVRRWHPAAGADAPGPGRAEAHHHGPPGRLGHQGRRRRRPGRRRCPFRPGQVPARPLPLLRSEQRSPVSSAAALNARLRGGMARERRLGAGNGQATDDPEADREHAVEDLCVACARVGLPARLTVHPGE